MCKYLFLFECVFFSVFLLIKIVVLKNVVLVFEKKILGYVLMREGGVIVDRKIKFLAGVLGF